MKRNDLSGQAFGYLTALSYLGTRSGKALWLCKCICGKDAAVSSSNLRTGNSRSCGCRTKLVASRVHRKHGETKRTVEYRTWLNMRNRCNNPNTPDFKNYGGRGIKVCDEWNEFKTFLSDMGRKPSDKYSIDRIDNDGNYEPSNCHWATRREQRINQRPR